MKRLWNSSLVVKVFLSYFVVVALLFLSFYFSSNLLLRHFYIRSLSTRMEQEAHLLARMVPFDEAGAILDSLCRQLSGELGARITIIAIDGRVLGDSAEISEHMENHGTRPEILEAIRTGTGTSIRYSTTVKYSMLYRAFHQTGPNRDRFVRLAVPLTDIDNVIRAFRQSLLGGLAVASAIGLLLAWAFSRHLSRSFQRLVQFSGQVAAGSFPQNFFPDSGSDEIALLERHLNEMSLRLRTNLSQIIEEKEKSDSILRCMVEGVLVLDPKGRVLVMNQQARAMFHVRDDLDVHGASVLEITRHPEIHRILEEILTFDFSTQTYAKEVELDDERWFRVNAVRLRDTQENLQGSILVFHDVTDIKRFESMRSDFVA
ncbi:MAG: PAS domain-containing protein, partial [Candidatus Binatia bacterium]